MSKVKPTVIDLFCGCGGLSYGFIEAGYDVVLGIDHWQDAIKTFEHNHKGSTGLVADLFIETKKGENKIRLTTARTNQDYFRAIVLSNYTFGCALTGISIPELSIASHIKPWSQDEKNRLNPAKGICLSATLDRAFDKGLISINKDFKVIFFKQIKAIFKRIIF